MARVQAPATALMVVGAMSFVITVLSIMLVTAGGGSYQIQPPDTADTSVSTTPTPAPSTERYSDDISREIAVLLGAVIVRLGLDALIMVAGYRMRLLRNWSLSMAGAVVALLPLSLCVFIGLPVGIWAIVVLVNQDVKRRFIG
jgi:hypothetical protein